jgi:dihydrolipoamide dehydrogenase
MADIEVRLPTLGEDAGDTAEVSFWQIEEGEDVAEGDSIVQMLTDKATFDVPCPAAGRIKEHKVAEGDKVKVGDVLCLLETQD